MLAAIPWSDVAVEAVFFVAGVVVAVAIAEYIDWRQERAAKRKEYDDWMQRKRGKEKPMVARRDDSHTALEPAPMRSGSPVAMEGPPSWWKGRRVLCTGSEGLIGQPLCSQLEEAEAILIPYDITDKESDVMDMRGLRKTFASYKPSVIYHMAAVSGVPQYQLSPYESHRLNIMGTLNVLQACHESSVDAVIIPSSNHIYGHQRIMPVDEEATLRQLEPYSAGKIAADYLARSYAHFYGLPVTVVRNTNCYGPHDPHMDHIVPGTIRSVMKGERPVIRGRGLTKKAYLYAGDVAEAFMLLGERQGCLPDKGEAFNVSTGNISVLDLVSYITRLMGSEIKPVVEGNGDDLADEGLDVSKLVDATGWKPRHTLEEGLRKTINGFKERYG